MNRVTFNTGAVLLVLIALPLAVGAITNTAGADEDRNWTPSYQQDYSGTTAYAYWLRNGVDMSNSYDLIDPTWGNCSYIEPQFPGSLSGSCAGVGGQTPFDFQGEIVDNTALGRPAIEMPVDHNSVGAYLGSSGEGPFSWIFTPAVNQIPDGEIPEAFKWTFVQPASTYSCTSTHFKNITYDAQVSWSYYDPTLPFGGVTEVFSVSLDDVESSNKLNYDAYVSGHWTTGCFIGLQVQIDLTGYEQVALNEAVRDYNWSSIYITLTLDDFRKDMEGEPSSIGTTELPWHGDSTDGEFLIANEYSTRNEAEINFFIRGGTLLVATVTFLIGVASTPYWDPLANWFRGRL